MTNEELRDWIDGEGGVGSLIEHGMYEKLDDPETQELWNLAVDAYSVFELHRGRLTRKIGY